VKHLRADDVQPRSECTRARWSAFWLAPRSPAARFKVASEGAVALRLDGRALSDETGRQREAGPIEPGLRQVEIEWAPPASAAARLRVLWGPADAPLRSLDDAWLFAERPSRTALAVARAIPVLRSVAVGGWILAALLGAVWLPTRRSEALQALRRRARAAAATLATPAGSRRAALALATLVVLYGAALRIEALRGGYWGASAPGWVQSVADVTRHLRPDTFQWPFIEAPYAHGDPGAYLRYGREMRNPYEPRVREPIFVLATKIGLWLAHGQRVGVSIASTFFSILVLVLTYILGAYAFSRWVGIGAALALAIEREAIAQGASGWRDEAFACFVLLIAWMALRLYDRGSFRDAVWLGLSCGLAWLTRITSPTLILPVIAVLAVFPRSRPLRQRLERAGVAGVVALAVAAPFLINCTIAFGDPFYAINEHVVFYRTRSHLEYRQGMTVADYLTKSFRPWQMADTVFIGFTAYPFAQKWSYADWAPWLGPALGGTALLGLLSWLASARGRLLLLAHLAAMVPFVFTYEARAGGPWRLTFHAYPFYLIAAFSALALIARLLVSATARRAVREWLGWRRGVWLATGLVLLAGGAWTLWHGLYYLRFAEAVRAGTPANTVPLFFAGQRDAFLFGRGWCAPRPAAGMSGRYVRVACGTSASLRLPLVAGRPVALVLALDPYVGLGQPAPTIGVALNGRELARLEPQWDAGKVGRYVVEVPGDAVRAGGNQLTLTASHATRAGDVINRPVGLSDDEVVSFGLQHLAVRTPGGRPAATRPPSRPASSGPGSGRHAPRSARPGA
jgi:4-amino-4-deoxy-L-arabinose transferase-like glycosyltransferase